VWDGRERIDFDFNLARSKPRDVVKNKTNRNGLHVVVDQDGIQIENEMISLPRTQH
jgi:hypothetical protein